MTPTAFIRANTRLLAVPLVPEVRLHLAGDVFDLWEKLREELGSQDPAMPYWAFAWPGGQALARYVLDNPEVVGGRRVLDLGSGSGLVAIAAAMAGAAEVMASEVDTLAAAAIALNAEANGVVGTVIADVLGGACDADVVLAGDVFYERATSARVVVFLERMRARGTRVLVGDLGRAFMPRAGFVPLAAYDVPGVGALEDADVKRTTVWQAMG